MGSSGTKLHFTSAGSEKRWRTNNEKQTGSVVSVRTLDRREERAMRALKTATDPQTRAGGVRTLPPQHSAPAGRLCTHRTPPPPGTSAGDAPTISISRSSGAILQATGDVVGSSIAGGPFIGGGLLTAPWRGPVREVVVNLHEGLMSHYWYDTTGRRERVVHLPPRSVLIRIKKQRSSS